MLPEFGNMGLETFSNIKKLPYYIIFHSDSPTRFPQIPQIPQIRKSATLPHSYFKSVS